MIDGWIDGFEMLPSELLFFNQWINLQTSQNPELSCIVIYVLYLECMCYLRCLHFSRSSLGCLQVLKDAWERCYKKILEKLKMLVAFVQMYFYERAQELWRFTFENLLICVISLVTKLLLQNTSQAVNFII